MLNRARSAGYIRCYHPLVRTRTRRASRVHTPHVMRQDNVALIAVLEATEAPGRSVNGDRRQLVCVANTHVHSNPELTDVKLWQVRAGANDNAI